MVFLPAPFCSGSYAPKVWAFVGSQKNSLPFADYRIAPHYPTASPLDDVLRYVAPGSDEYVTEKYADEIGRLLSEWSGALERSSRASEILGRFTDPSIQSNSLRTSEEKAVRSGNGIDIRRRKFAVDAVNGREAFVREVTEYLAGLSRLETAEFQITGITEKETSPLRVEVKIRYDLLGAGTDGQREERIGNWRTEWQRDESGGWRAVAWEAAEETSSRAGQPVFVEVTTAALGGIESYQKQLAHGVDYWRTVLDGACGIDVYGNNGIAAGDYDNDGRDDLYICQPPGLPNRLYRNRGDGTFEDVTEEAGVGVLDGTACALFADFENKGLQDLLVVCASGPLLFVNQGNGKFSVKRDAFQFQQAPQGTFTHAAAADYDGDGQLDVYFCLYSYYLGLDQYHYPAPYFDARNGPPNFLLHNEGNGRFVDRTREAGLSAENDRYSFACAWGDSNGDGRPDLYVANDFGRNNLYRNRGDGTFAAVSEEAKVNSVGAGMSACWLDADNDGRPDIYVSDMWSAAGMRVSEQKIFHEKEPENIRELFREHARGDAFYRNTGNGKFENASAASGARMGGWAWSSDSWDFDHDGYADLYVTNGYISGPNGRDAAGFFWRQVVAKSPADTNSSERYERGWNAINELIRSDGSWSGGERNVLYANNRDGTFSDVSGLSGLDLADDSRAFALADVDHDGRLEVVLKNRTGPQIRVLRNGMTKIGSSIAFQLQGVKSNRDGIGAAVTVECGNLRQTKYLQAGSGFLSQHSKELFFGLGKSRSAVRASIHWPSGLVQTLDDLPAEHRIKVREGDAVINARSFASAPAIYGRASESAKPERLPRNCETWLIEPLAAPDFTLPDLQARTHQLHSLAGKLRLLHFWASASPECGAQLRRLQGNQGRLRAAGLTVVSVNADDPSDAVALSALVAKEGVAFPVLLATRDVLGVYNIIYRYLFDRRRDLGVPTSFLINSDGMIEKIYQGELNIETLIDDVKTLPIEPTERAQKALPMRGTLYGEAFQRNDFTYGVALFQRGYLEQAAASFQQVIKTKPGNAEAYYNLGSLYLRENSADTARPYFEQALKLRPNYPEAWNNLGMVAAQEGQDAEAVRNFQQSLLLRPNYGIALLNLGNLYRRQGNLEKAEESLARALGAEPENADVQYSAGMLFARKGDMERATQYLEEAIRVRPAFPDALNNLGVLLVRQKKFDEAKEKFQTCIRVAPKFDQAYLNLARLYVLLNDKEKAREVLEALLKKEPDHQMARQALEMLN